MKWLLFVPFLFSIGGTTLSAEENLFVESTPCYIHQEKQQDCEEAPAPSLSSSCCPDNSWYLAVKPCYYFLEDKDMKQFFGTGGFAFRAETGCVLRGPLMIWVDGGYYQETGTAIGGTEKLDLKLATMTLGLKWIYYFSSWAGIYAGAGPRLFLMMLHNDSPYVRGDDNEIGIGGGFDAGLWLFPVPQWRNFFFDLYADYSLKNMHVGEDEISSLDSNIDLSGLSVGLGIGFRF